MKKFYFFVLAIFTVSGCVSPEKNVSEKIEIMPQKASAAPAASGEKESPQAVSGGRALKDADAQFPFYVYKDKGYKDNHFYPSGYMGDFNDLKADEGCPDSPYSPPNCIRISYSARKSQGVGWAGIFWQNPANNWGKVEGGFNLAGAKKITFWARGAQGDELVEFKMGGIKEDYPDTGDSTSGPVVLSKDWKQYDIDLSGLDLSYISGGFCYVINATDNPEGGAVYLDDIRYEK